MLFPYCCRIADELLVKQQNMDDTKQKVDLVYNEWCYVISSEMDALIKSI